jgi:hypothetical protein
MTRLQRRRSVLVEAGRAGWTRHDDWLVAYKMKVPAEFITADRGRWTGREFAAAPRGSWPEIDVVAIGEPVRVGEGSNFEIGAETFADRARQELSIATGRQADGVSKRVRGRLIKVEVVQALVRNSVTEIVPLDA